MADRTFSDAQIGRILRQLATERATYWRQMEVRRRLIELGPDAVGEPLAGSNVPEAYRKSEIMLRAMSGAGVKATINFAGRVAANEPQVMVIPVSTSKNGVGKRIDQRAAEQERLLMSIWEAAKGRAAHRQVSWDQSWGRVGWYFTLPALASWGLPSREYYEDLTDDEVETMRSKGIIGPQDEDGRYPESAETWSERRREKAQENAINARSLFTLETFPPDMVLPRYEDDGTATGALRYGFIVKELPASDFEPGSELAVSAAKYMGDVAEEDYHKYGIYLRDGKVEGGISRGGEPKSQPGSMLTLSIFVTRNEVYYYVTSGLATAGQGMTIWHDAHGAGKVPLIPVPAKRTGSRKPGNEYTGHMEQVFAELPMLNQLETLMSNVAVWNSFMRMYIVDPELRDDEGEATTIKLSDSVPGMDPGQIAMARGEIKQLVNEGMQPLLAALTFFTERFESNMPSGVTEGEAGDSAAAWQVKLRLDSADDLLEESVDNHADAVKEVMLLWIRWLRMLDEPVYAFAAPGNRGSDRSVRGLIEFNPQDLVETIDVAQSSMTERDRVASQQMGIELEAGGHIDAREKYEVYFLSQDPEEAEQRAIAAVLLRSAIFGTSEQVQPGSVAADLVIALRGAMDNVLWELLPSYRINTATRVAETAAIQAAQQGGNVADAAGVVEPGMGMSLDIPALSQPQSIQ